MPNSMSKKYGLSLKNIKDYEWLSISEDEDVIWKTHPSLIPKIPEFLFSLLGIIASIASVFLLKDYYQMDSRLYLIPVILIVVLSLVMLTTYIRVKSTFYVFTDNEVAYKENIVRIRSYQYNYDEVQNNEYTQSFIESLLNLGTFKIATAGTGVTEMQMEDIPHPTKAQDIVSEQKEME